MKTLVKAFLIILPLFIFHSIQAQDAQLGEMVQSTFDGFNERNGTSYVAHFTEDVDYISPTGPHIKGKNKIEKTYNMLFSKNLIPTRNPWKVTNYHVRYLADGVALVVFSGAIKEDNVYGNGSATALLKDGEWKLSSFQLTFLQNQEANGDE